MERELCVVRCDGRWSGFGFHITSPEPNHENDGSHQSSEKMKGQTKKQVII